MSNKNIPAIGERDANSVPGKSQWAHVTVGPATTCDVVIGDTAAYTLFNVEEPIMVVRLLTQVATAFTASVTLDIGDSTTAALFTSDTTIVPPTTGAVLVESTGLTVPYVYAAEQDILVDVNGATVAAGLLHVYMEYVVLQD